MESDSGLPSGRSPLQTGSVMLVTALPALTLFLAQAGPSTAMEDPTRVVCLGDSITTGARIVQPERLVWSAQLEARLNVDERQTQVEVAGFGVGGATLLAKGDRPIQGTKAYTDALAESCDHFVVMLGTNDTVQAGRGNWEKADGFVGDLETLCAAARERSPAATVWIVGPPPMFPGARGLDEARVASLTARAPRREELARRAKALAQATPGVEHISLDGVLTARRTVDGVHPDPFGHEDIARAVHSSLAPAMGHEVAALRSLQPAPSAEYRAGAGWGGTWWDAFDALRELGDQDMPSPGIVFLGDSITQGLTGHARRRFELAGRSAVSIGLSGDRTEHLRYRIRHGALRRWRPELIVLQIGINNLNAAKHSPDDTAAGIEAVVGDLRERHPQARILVCGPFPAGRTAKAPLRLAVDAVHARIRTIGEGTDSKLLGGAPQVHYLDLRDRFLTDEGAPSDAMAGDALHLARKGQDIWRAEITRWAERELGGAPR